MVILERKPIFMQITGYVYFTTAEKWLFWLTTNLKALLIWIRLLAYLLAHLVALKAAGTGQEANFGLWMSGGRYVCQMNWLDCTFSGATFLKVRGNPPPARELASRTPAQKLSVPGDPSLPMTLLPSLGKPSLTFMLAVCIKSAPLSHSTWFCFPQHLAPP